MKNLKFNKLNFSQFIDMFVKSLLISLVLTLIIGYLVGFNALIVKGYSSEPTIPYQSLVIEYKNTKLEDLKVGDYITWKSGKSFTTHKIVAIKTKGYFQSDDIITIESNGSALSKKYSELNVTNALAKTNCNIITQQKGDVSAACDTINYSQHFAGKVIYILPLLGKIVQYVKINFQQLVFSIVILYVAYVILKIEPKYIRLF